MTMEVHPMAIQYKTDVIAALKNAGYSSYRIRKESVSIKRRFKSCGKAK